MTPPAKPFAIRSILFEVFLKKKIKSAPMVDIRHGKRKQIRQARVLVIFLL